jgi:hypothetical protein
MQPPLTEPTASPAAFTNIEAPAGRGADRQVRTTVAIAVVSPELNAAIKSSSTSFKMMSYGLCVSNPWSQR